MSDQHIGLPVQGYTAQPDTNVQIVNRNKVLEEICLRRLDELQQSGQHDPRCLALARTDLQQAFMWMNRAVFQPKRLDGDLSALG